MNREEAACDDRQYCDKLVQCSLPKYHCSTISSVLKKTKFLVMEIFCVACIAVFTIEEG